MWRAIFSTYVLNMQQSCNERNIIFPLGYYIRTLSEFNVEKIRHNFLIISVKWRIMFVHSRYNMCMQCIVILYDNDSINIELTE